MPGTRFPIQSRKGERQDSVRKREMKMFGRRPATRITGIGMCAAAVAIAAAISVCPSAASRAASVARSNDFELWNKCQPMGLEVVLDGGRAGLGFPAHREVSKMVRTALERARLFDRHGARFILSIRATAIAKAYTYEVAFQKPVWDSLSRVPGVSTTWRTGGLKPYWSKRSALAEIREAFEKFLDEFLRVNAVACRR